MPKILFPIDGSEATYDAVDRALKLLKPGKDSAVTFLCVLSKKLRDMPADAREYLEFDDEDELFLRPDEAKTALAKAEDIARKLKIPNVKSVILEGEVEDVIRGQCRTHDLLVMHGLRRDEKEDKAHDSLVEPLARKAGIDVLLTRTE